MQNWFSEIEEDSSRASGQIRGQAHNALPDVTSPAEAGLDSAPYRGLSSPGRMAALGRVLDADPISMGERLTPET